MVVEMFDIRLPDIVLEEFNVNSEQEANNMGRAKIVEYYRDALRQQGVILGRYDYRIKCG